MALNTNASRLYVVEETTSGTLKVPSAGSEALALQPGFEFTPEVDVLTNDELRSSIGPAKPITGLERPTASFSHYYRHSGTEGVVPDWHLLMKSLFGSTSTNGTERTLTTGSSTTLLKLAAGGSDFATTGGVRKAVLIKDGTNGYSIRPVDAVATNDLTLGFSVPNAPATGVTLGKCVNYSPVDSGHPTLSLWLYRANGGAIEAEAGCLITNLDLSVETGQLINMSFTAGGTLFYFDPIVITASNKYIDFEDDDGVATAVLQEKIYRTPLELAQAAEDAINAQTTETWTVTYHSTGANAGKFTFSATGTTVELQWNTGANTANSAAAKFGFSAAADNTGATTYTSATAKVWSDALTPSLDSSDPLVAKDNEVLIGDQDDYVSMCVQSMTANIGLDVQDVTCIKAVSGVDSKVVRRRNTSIEITAVLDRHDADKFDRFINNTNTKFLFNAGVKSGGNWVAGRCLSLYAPKATVSGWRVGDNDGIVTMIFTISPFVDTDGTPEIFLNLL